MNTDKTSEKTKKSRKEYFEIYSRAYYQANRLQIKEKRKIRYQKKQRFCKVCNKLIQIKDYGLCSNECALTYIKTT